MLGGEATARYRNAASPLITSGDSGQPSAAAHDRLAAYLEQCRWRLNLLGRAWVAAGAAALLAAGALACTAALRHLTPSAPWVWGARFVMYAALAAGVVAVIWRRVDGRGAARWLEKRAPDFDGRVATWLDATGRAQPPALAPTLAAEALGMARRHPARRLVAAWMLAPPVLVALLAAGVLGWLHIGAPESWRLPAERLWLGATFTDTEPRIVVEPGDAVVTRGADLLIRARPHGFVADRLRLHASFAGSADPEQAEMRWNPGADAGEFVLVAVPAPLTYFVAAAGVYSARFHVDVAELPALEGLQVALEYPSWTRLPARTQSHGDLSAVAGTVVRVRVDAAAPLPGGALVVGERATPLVDGGGVFTVDAAGTWHVAARHLGQRVPISESFIIDVRDDAPPEVELAFPSGDRTATAIEEVAVRLRAEDDFGVDALTLRYAVNGGAWRPLASETEGRRQATGRHLIALETLRGDDGRAMRPGDVVALYAEARDRASLARTGLLFVDVRPFARRYRERQGGGGAGQGSGGGGLELAARQRDIVAATWNLIRARDERAEDDGLGELESDDFQDQVELVALLQGDLLAQARTLVARAEGRRLSADAAVAPFVRHLADAAPEMELAAAALAQADLDGAVPAEQRALNHLLTAEAALRDVDVSWTRAASSADAAGRSLSELVDLELDPERNRYETPQQPTFGQRAESQEDEWRRLTELARRQEQLAARQAGQERLMPQSRWQLERLHDELEALRERLARQNGGGGQREGGGRAARSGGEASPDLTHALAEIDSARQAVADALADDAAGAEALQTAAAALRAGAERIRAGGEQALSARVGAAERQAAALLAEQERIESRLREWRDDRLEASRQAGQSGRFRFYDYSLADEADAKRRMNRALTGLDADLADAKTQLEARAPDAARQIDLAMRELADARVRERLAVAAEYFAAGRPLYLVPQEAGVTDALASFAERLAEAARQLPLAGGDAAMPPVEQVRALRRRLADARANGDAGALTAIAAAADRLQGEVFDGSGVADPEAPALAAEAARAYRGRGASAANRQRLADMVAAHLDRIEIALAMAATAPVRAEAEREDGYDSDEVARYFRQLSCGGDC